MLRVHFAILIDYSSAQSRHLSEFIRSRFDGYISYLSFARNSSGKKGEKKRIGLRFVLIPTRGNTVPQFVNTGLFIYYLYKYIHVVWRIARLSVHARVRGFVVYKFSLY